MCRASALAKNHKGQVQNSCIPPLREVVSGSGSNTEYISKYVDHYTKHLVQHLPSYVQDTPDILRKIAVMTMIQMSGKLISALVETIGKKTLLTIESRLKQTV